MSEQTLQNQIRLELSKLGYTVFRVNVGKIKMQDGRWFDTGLPVGFSDLIAIKDGTISFIEVKFGKNKTSKDQNNFLYQMRLKGCKAGVVYSVEDAIKLLNN
jgi:hypothetical protein